MKILALATLIAITPVVAHADMFNGPYVGAQLGWENNKVDPLSKLPANVGSLITSATSAKKSGLSYGINGGYDVTLASKFVLGGEGALSLTSGKLNQAVTLTDGTNLSINSKVKYTWELSGRAGYLLAPNALLFARAGYAQNKIRFDIPVSATNLTDINITGNRGGFLVGGGLEYGLSKNLSARAEYRYVDFKSASNRNQILFGLGYHF